MKRILPLLIVLILIPMISSCGESKAEKEEKARIEAARLENELKLEIERREKEKEEASFTTDKGTYYIEDAIDHLHNIGTSHGSTDRSLGHSRTGYESKAKQMFLHFYGLPNNNKAKDVYTKAVKAYQKGYNEGYDF